VSGQNRVRGTFLELIDEEIYPCRSGGKSAAGTSTTAVLLVFGPDAEEVQAINDRLQAALLDHIRWQQTEGPPAEWNFPVEPRALRAFYGKSDF
jgi:hypothetical protein